MGVRLGIEVMCEVIQLGLLFVDSVAAFFIDIRVDEGWVGEFA
jgi:hypothetical protein